MGREGHLPITYCTKMRPLTSILATDTLAENTGKARGVWGALLRATSLHSGTGVGYAEMELNSVLPCICIPRHSQDLAASL